LGYTHNIGLQKISKQRGSKDDAPTFTVMEF
jgi:hypothetical protein